MAIKKNASRQELIVAHLNIGYADPTTYGNAENAFDLPGNAIVLGGDVVVKTPWNSATTATLKLGDAVDDDRYTASPIDLKTAGRTALTLSGYTHTVAEALKATIAQTGAGATAGAARITISYYVEGRSAFTQG
ncbi:hypothetical protein AVHY2522_23800 [Acidovorax sp. SUPP2522]|uniref:hypothetical protein n=1 Tax=unclassified Acidovorax TaxID=2684926 RepID=UPI00234B679D|nr:MULTISPECIES: hypothetical protein [unclassified Acidovorax]WCM96240.1 hypothetical protein M5C96_17615 [Acidovorax sp. GBBC 1281]GKT19797.1 hypothetical protein AVHY2522_23800 [Acidovorax sp. SUPP2522]